MKRLTILLLVCILQISCTANDTSPSEPSESIKLEDASAPVTIRKHSFEVDAWVSDPNPQVGSRVMLYGSLLKDGVYLGGIAMQATWPNKNQKRGVPNCVVQVIYGSGVCVIESEGYQKNVYVPITVTFEYQGQSYSGQTGFTVR